MIEGRRCTKHIQKKSSKNWECFCFAVVKKCRNRSKVCSTFFFFFKAVISLLIRFCFGKKKLRVLPFVGLGATMLVKKQKTQALEQKKTKASTTKKKEWNETGTAIKRKKQKKGEKKRSF